MYLVGAISHTLTKEFFHRINPLNGTKPIWPTNQGKMCDTKLFPETCNFEIPRLNCSIVRYEGYGVT